MKNSFGLRYYLYLLDPWFFAVFADCSYILIGQRWDIIPFVLPAEAFFYILPLLTTSFFIRKGLHPLLKKKADKSRAIKLLMGTPVLGNDEIGRLTVRFNHMLKGLQERELHQSTFGKYLTRELTSQVLSQGGIIKPESRLVTVLFTDIENYTTLSENLPPKEVIALLNSYFSGIIAIIGRHRGLVNKFIRDAVMGRKEPLLVFTPIKKQINQENL